MLSQVLRIKLNSIKKYYFLLIFNVPFWLTTNPKADVQFSSFRPIGDGGHQTNQTSKIKALVNTRHVDEGHAVAVPRDIAKVRVNLKQIDSVVSARIADGR